MANYTNFVIVAEDEFYTKSGVSVYNILWEISGEISTSTNINYLKAVHCKSIVSPEKKCHTEVVFIKNNSIAHQTFRDFEFGEYADMPGKYASADSIVIRILESKEKFLKQLEQRWTLDVYFLVNGEKCAANRRYLASVSPVFDKMLYGEFAESKQNEIPFQECESANIFSDFILAISPFRIQPNPTNVVALLKLAHQYDIPFLIHNCEEHFKHCYEIPMVDRLILAAKYDLKLV